jgi:hypothetical protein
VALRGRGPACLPEVLKHVGAVSHAASRMSQLRKSSRLVSHLNRYDSPATFLTAVHVSNAVILVQGEKSVTRRRIGIAVLLLFSVVNIAARQGALAVDREYRQLARESFKN